MQLLHLPLPALLLLATTPSITYGTNAGNCYQLVHCQNEARSYPIPIAEEAGKFTLFLNVSCASNRLSAAVTVAALTSNLLVQTAPASSVRARLIFAP